MKIVLIDDEADICIVMKFMLQRSGFEVTSFTSAQEAQDYLKNNSYDAVVSDFQMTPMTGLALFRWLKEQGNNKPFVLLTGEPFMNLEELLEEGIHQVLFKPHGLDDIVKVLQELN